MSRQDDRLATISRNIKKPVSAPTSTDPFFDFLSSAYKSAEKAISHSTKIEDAHILGTKYTLDEHGKALFEHHAQSLFRLTYRRDFPALAPYNITSDAGWGCMIRAVQMMMAEAFRVHYLGRGQLPSSKHYNAFGIETLCVIIDCKHCTLSFLHLKQCFIRTSLLDWRLPLQNTSETLSTNEEYCKVPNNQQQLFGNTLTPCRRTHSSPSCTHAQIVRMFLDYPGDPHYYSLHHLVQGASAHDKLPGEWWGPSTAAHVLRYVARCVVVLLVPVSVSF